MTAAEKNLVGAPPLCDVPTPELVDRLALAKTIGVETGNILLDFAENGVREQQKGRVDFVTDADHAAEDFLLDKISKAYPNDAIIAEEGGGALSRDGFGWVVDPLDGTTNFMHGVPHYAVSVGIAYAGIPVGGAIIDPSRGEVFTSARGQGAFLGDKKISTSSRQELKDALLATGFPYDRRPRADELMARIKRALLNAHGIRRAGAAALDLCWLACGRYDGFFEQTLNSWDTCAGVSLIWEAGGSVTDYEGNAYTLHAPSLVASNGHFHKELLGTVVEG